MFLWLFIPPLALASFGCALLPIFAILVTSLFDIDAKPRLLVLSFIDILLMLDCFFIIVRPLGHHYKHCHGCDVNNVALLALSFY
jgi:hypothetical protein